MINYMWPFFGIPFYFSSSDMILHKFFCFAFFFCLSSSDIFWYWLFLYLFMYSFLYSFLFYLSSSGIFSLFLFSILLCILFFICLLQTYFDINFYCILSCIPLFFVCVFWYQFLFCSIFLFFCSSDKPLYWSRFIFYSIFYYLDSTF